MRHRKLPARKLGQPTRNELIRVLWRSKSCSYCRSPMTKRRSGGPPRPTDATVDHKIPQSRGGTDDRENLAPCCYRCNQEKADMTPEEFVAWRNAEDGPSVPFVPQFEPIPLPSIPISESFSGVVTTVDPATLPPRRSCWGDKEREAKKKATASGAVPPITPPTMTRSVYEGQLPPGPDAAKLRLSELKAEIDRIFAAQAGTKGEVAVAMSRKLAELAAERRAVRTYLSTLPSRHAKPPDPEIPLSDLVPVHAPRSVKREQYRARMLASWRASSVADPQDPLNLISGLIAATQRMMDRLGREWTTEDRAVVNLASHYLSPMKGVEVDFNPSVLDINEEPPADPDGTAGEKE